MTIDIEFYCLLGAGALCVISLAMWWCAGRQLRKARAHEAPAILAYDDIDAERATLLQAADDLRSEIEKWKGRAHSYGDSSRMFAKRWECAQAELDALKNPPRGERGRFVGKAKVAVG